MRQPCGRVGQEEARRGEWQVAGGVATWTHPSLRRPSRSSLLGEEGFFFLSAPLIPPTHFQFSRELHALLLEQVGGPVWEGDK